MRRRLSTPEKIVSFFADRGITEAHRAAIEGWAGIDAEQWEQSIATARDIAAEEGFSLTPIYERPGWWTVDPTQHVAAVALYESARRNMGEAERNARVLSKLSGVSKAALLVEASHIGTKAVIEKELADDLALSLGLDYVIARVDDAASSGKDYVERKRERAAA